MNITLDLTDAAKNFMIDKGYDPKYGARPLKRTIQNELEDRLAEALLDGTVRSGETVRVDYAKPESGPDTGVTFTEEAVAKKPKARSSRKKADSENAEKKLAGTH